MPTVRIDRVTGRRRRVLLLAIVAKLALTAVVWVAWQWATGCR
jgi:hypothetical protein